MAKTCEYNYGGACDRIATTILTRNNGEVQQLCEVHHDVLINLFKGIASGDVHMLREDAQVNASHWLVKNKIPS